DPVLPDSESGTIAPRLTVLQHLAAISSRLELPALKHKEFMMKKIFVGNLDFGATEDSLRSSRTAGAKHALRLPGGWAKALAMVLAVMAVSCMVAVAAIDRGNIQGTVADEQNAVIPGAKVVVKNLDTNVEVALTTNNSGVYQASELVPGRYSV